MPEDLTSGPQDMGVSPEAEPRPTAAKETELSHKGAEAWFGVENKSTEELMDIFRQDGMILVHETKRPEAVLVRGALISKHGLNTEARKPIDFREGTERLASAAVHFTLNRVYNFDREEVDTRERIKYFYDNSGKMTGFFAHPGVLATDHDIGENLLLDHWGKPHSETQLEDVTVRGTSEDQKDPNNEIDVDKMVFFAPKNVLVYGNGEIVEEGSVSLDKELKRVRAEDLEKEGAELLATRWWRDDPDHPAEYGLRPRGLIKEEKIERAPKDVIMRSEDYWQREFKRMEAKGQQPPKHVFFYDGMTRKGALQQFREANNIPTPDYRKFYEAFRQLEPEVVEHKHGSGSDYRHGQGEGKFFRAGRKQAE